MARVITSMSRLGWAFALAGCAGSTPPSPEPPPAPTPQAHDHCAGEVTVRDHESPRPMIQGRHTAPVVELAWGPEGRLASASEDGSVRAWDVDTGMQLLSYRHPESDAPTAVAWKDGRLLAQHVHDDRLVSLDGSAEGSPFTPGSPLKSPADRLQPAGDRWVGLMGTAVASFDASGQELDRTDYLDLNDFAVSAGGEVVAVLADDALLYWSPDALSERPHRVAVDVADRAWRFALSPDGSEAVIASLVHGDRSPRSRVDLYSLETGEHRPLSGDHPFPWDLSLNEDGQFAAAATKRALIAWDLETREKVLEVPLSARRGFRSVALSPDGRWLVAGTTDGAIRRYRLPSGRYGGELGAAARFPRVRPVFAGDRLLVVSDGRLTSWSLSSGMVVSRRERSTRR